MRERGMAWSNWSGSVTANGQVARPQSEDELAALVRGATKLRVTGAGHSFMPLCESDELIVSLDAMAGTIRLAADRRTAHIPAGWSVRRLTAALWEEGDRKSTRLNSSH